MDSRDRQLQFGIAALVLLHSLAFLFWPESLWGLSHLAAWPRAVGLVWSALALVGLAWLPRFDLAPSGLPFPGPRRSMLLGLAAGVCFWLARERTHFFGDGYLLVRDQGHSQTATHAPLLVGAIESSVAALGRLGWPAESVLAALAVAGGVLGVFAALRLAAVLASDRGGKFLAASLLLGGGCMQLFCGHVEYYATIAVCILAWMWVACRALERREALWPTWILFGVLLALHLSTLALVPAQLWLGLEAWRRGERRATALAVLAGAACAAALARLAGAGAGALAGNALGWFQRCLEPYRAAASSRHDFGFLSPAHALAVLNDLLLVAPLAVAALPALSSPPRSRSDTLHRFLATASAGGLALSIVFHRELGPYRDWDILAPLGFVYLAWTAAAIVRPRRGPWRIAIVLVLVGGLHHLLPWVALNASARAAFLHTHLVLASGSQWSPHARGYLHEEFAIYRRARGDRDGARAEYEAAVDANPADARYRVGLGSMYVQCGDLERAAAAFAAALGSRPDYAPAHNNLAFVLAKLGRDLDAARQHADAALRLQPGDPDYLLTLARVQVASGDWAGARVALEAALRSRPGMREAGALLEEVRAREERSPAAR